MKSLVQFISFYKLKTRYATNNPLLPAKLFFSVIDQRPELTDPLIESSLAL